DLPCVRGITAVELGVIRKQLETGLNSIPTSSMGRLFDAAAALPGIRQTVTYEAQAAIEFESLVDPTVAESYRFRISDTESHGEDTESHGDNQEGFSPRLPRSPRLKSYEIDPTPLFAALAADVQKGVKTAIIAAKFHNAVADLILQLSHILRDQTGINQVALSGGVFQNATLLEKAITRLHAADFESFTHHLVPANDGGLALGQAVIYKP
ncbi:MAG: carbamoyltransferase HypF, partial [Chloroflexota bacterium]